MTVLFALLLAAQAAGDVPPPGGAAPTEMIANCNAHKFETIVQVMKDGTPRSRKVTICGKVGQTDDDWVATLKDAMSKVAADPKMLPAVRDQIVTALKFELTRLASSAPVKVEPPLTSAPALPQPVQTATLVPRAQLAANAPAEYSALPPMPAPKPVVNIPVGTAVAVTQLPAPRLTLRCQSTTAMVSEGPCDQLERETLVTVVAGEDVPGGTSLRFLRRGDNRAEVDLAPLKRGQSQRFTLPAKVCQGVTGSRVEVQVVRAVKSSSQVVDTRGPFELRC